MSTMTSTVYGPGGYDPTKHDNNVVSVETIDVPQEPMSHAGALATMLAVAEVLTVENAAAAVGLPPGALVAEAQAWAAAAQEAAAE